MQNSTLSLILLSSLLIWSTGPFAEAEQPALFFESPLGRRVFLEGESIELVLVLRPGTAAENRLAVSLTFEREEAQSWSAFEKQIKRNPGAPVIHRLLLHSRITSVLRPGRYRLQASFGNLKAEPYQIEIVSLAKQTLYPVVSWHHIGYSRHIPKLVGTPGRVDNARRSQGGLEYNVSHNHGRPEDLLRRGIAFIGDLYLGDWELIPEYMGRQARKLERFAQQHRKYPNFIGINMKTQDEFMGWGERWISSAAAEKSIRERSGFISTGISGHMRPGDRELTRWQLWQEFRRRHNLPDQTIRSVPFDTRAFKGLVSAEHPRLYLKWMEFLHGTVTNRMHRFHRREIDRILPNILWSTNRYMPIAFGHDGHSLYKAVQPRIYCAMDPSLAGGGIDLFVVNPDGYDWNNEAFESAVHADMVETQRVRGKPVWKVGYGTQGFHFFGSRQQLLRDCLMPIARGVVPATSDSFEKGEAYLNNSDEWPHVGYGNRERYSLISGMLKVYGGMFLQLQKEKDAAILFSHSQDCLSANERMAHGYSIWQAAVSAWMAHVPTTFISEQDILRGELSRYKALILTKIDTAIPRDVRDRIQRFVDSGGAVIADQKTDLPIEGMKRVNAAFDGYLTYMTAMHYDRTGRFGPRPERRSQWAGMRQAALKTMPPLREALRPHMPRLVDCDNPHVFLSVSSAGTMKVVFCVNFTPETYGTRNEKPDARYSIPDTPRPIGISQLESTWVRPLVQKLTFRPGNYRIYDLFAQREVRPRKGRAGWTVEADLRALEGRVYVLLPEPVGAITLRATQTVPAGSQMSLRVEVTGESGKRIEGPVPIEVRALGPEDAEIYRLYRASTDGKWDGKLKVAANDPTGTWKIVARELLSGHTASIAIAVSAADNFRPEVEPATNDVIVDEVDRSQILRFLHGQKRAAIFIDQPQSELRGLAEKLQAGLAGRGVQADLVSDLDEIQIGPGPDIRLPLVLLGRPGFNRLIDQLNKIDRRNNEAVTLRRVSPNYPPPGAALLQHVSSAFAPRVNTVLLQANDRAGLEKAVDALLSLEEPESIERSPIQKARCDMLPFDFRTYREQKLGQKLPTALQLPTAPGKLTSTATITGRIEKALFAERIGVPIYAIAFSPDGSRIAVGTDARVGPDKRDEKNLFLLNRAGKLLSKGQASEHLIGKVAFGAGGERIFASVQMSGTLEIFDLKLRPVRKHDAAIYPGDYDAPYFHLSPDSRVIYRLARPDLLLAEDTTTGRELWRHNFAPKDDSIKDLKYRLGAFAVSSGGSRIGLIVRQDGVKPIKMHRPGNVKTWTTVLKAADGSVVSQWTGQAGMSNGWNWRHQHGQNGEWPSGSTVALSPDGRLLATPKHLGVFSLYDETGRELAQISCRQPQRLLFTPDGRRMISWWILREAPMRGVVDSYSLTFIDVEQRKVVARVTGDESISDADLSPDGRTVAVLWWDGTLRAYDLSGREQWQTFIGTGGRVKFSPDGKAILVGTWAGRLLLCDAVGGILWKKELPRD